MIRLGVNIDHVATLRQARRTRYPSPVQAALMAESAGADAITLHLREDRRHIQDQDLEVLRSTLQTRMNLELAVTDEMLAIATRVRPQDVCLVPERRQELTTEGGLDVAGQFERISAAVTQLSLAGIRVSLFISTDARQIEAAHASGAPVIELHTGHYADSEHPAQQTQELAKVERAMQQALGLGLQVNAGHGLNYHNVTAIAQLQGLTELNIGHAIVAHAIFVGWDRAVREMKSLIVEAGRRR